MALRLSWRPSWQGRC
ncbi:hypothetical protein Taro_039800 [Colocasia esculenta]|uniref:Uncharacterized protein n=1 Tax=Colocasia esculenta TaxID=4460 RepID=A0A843WJY4_COLES|nr:hypothetical protein [Colocasia esculenta]